MKITICVGKLTGGGAERVASMWAMGFRKIGHEVSIVVMDKKSPITYSIPKDAAVFEIDCNIFSNRILNFVYRTLFQSRKLHKVFSQIKPDVVIAVLPSWGPLIYKAKGKLNFKVVGTDHNSYERPAYAPMTKKQQWLKFEFNKQFDWVTVITEADKEVIGSRFDNVSVLPNPLAFEPVKCVPPKENVILAVGRIDAWYYKGFDLLIEAWGKLSNQYADWKLQILGDGNDYCKSILQNKARECGLIDSIELIPYTNNPIELYRKASIFVLSSRYEGFGMVLIEAMSQGCACIASDYQGRQREIISSREIGLTCNPDSVESLYEALNEMMVNENYRESVRLYAVERSKDFNLDRVMDKWTKILGDLDEKI